MKDIMKMLFWDVVYIAIVIFSYASSIHEYLPIGSPYAALCIGIAPMILINIAFFTKKENLQQKAHRYAIYTFIAGILIYFIYSIIGIVTC